MLSHQYIAYILSNWYSAGDEVKHIIGKTNNIFDQNVSSWKVRIMFRWRPGYYLKLWWLNYMCPIVSIGPGLDIWYDVLLLPRCLSNFKAMRRFNLPILWLRGFTIFYGKTSNRILKRRPGRNGCKRTWNTMADTFHMESILIIFHTCLHCYLWKLT